MNGPAYRQVGPLGRPTDAAVDARLSHKKIILISRCSWSVFNFRRGLARFLQRQGADVITAGGGGDGFDKQLREHGIDFKALPISQAGLTPLADVRCFLYMIYWFLRERPEIIHFFTIKPAVYGNLAARLTGVPVRITTVTGLGYPFRKESRLLQAAVEFLYRRALAGSARIFFQNADDMSLFVDRGIVDPSMAELAQGSGVDLDWFKPDVEVAPRSAKIRFVMISRLLREKGVMLFLEAAERLKRSGGEASFTLVGDIDGGNPHSLSDAEVARIRASDAVQWVGRVQDVRPYLAEADVLVLPSYYREGVPRVLLEAAAMEKAIITTDEVGCREAVLPGTTGIVVPARDGNALTAALTQLIHDPGLARAMGRAGRQYMRDRFDEMQVCRDTVLSYIAALNVTRE
jgi:glycosyltransferase involved in cell wall biosynthesis